MVGDGHGVVVVDAVIGSPNTVAEGDNNNNCDREEGGCQLSRCFCSSVYITLTKIENLEESKCLYH